jgi:hypothetical protein
MAINTDWVYQLTDVTQDKSIRRVGISDRSRAPDLVGFDGSVEGSLRPHKGFSEVVDLATSVGIPSASHGGLNIAPGDLQPFSVRADATRNVIGYVFRDTNSGPSYQFYICWYWEGAWSGAELVSTDTTISYSGANAGGNWSVFTQKTNLYVYLKGFSPLRVTFPVDDSGTSASTGDDTVTLTVLSQDLDSRPKIYAFDEYEDVITLTRVPFIPESDGSTIVSEDGTTVIPASFVFGAVKVTDIDREGTAAAGRFSQTFGTRFADAGPDTPNLTVSTHGVVSGVESSLIDGGPDGAGGTPEDNFEFPLSSPQVQKIQTNLNAQASTLSAYATTLSVPKFPGNKFLGVMIELFNSTTGVRSLPSEVSELNIRYQDSQVAFEGVVDSATYDTVRMFRTVAGDTVGAGQATLYLIAEYPITEITSPYQFDSTYVPPDVDNLASGVYTSEKYTRVSGVFNLSDVAVMYQPPLLDRIQYAESAPKGGIARLYNGVAFLTDIEGTADLDNSVGEVLYSTLSETRPEAFPPVNRFLPEQATDTIQAWAVSAGNLLGFSRTQQYFARIEGQFVKFLGIHDGFGITGRHAHETVSDQVYLMTTKGLMMVNGRGALEGIDVFNDLIINDWRQSLTNITMAFDPDTAALFIMNPDQEEASVVWMTTSKTTQMHDLPFSGVVKGITFNDEIKAQFYRSDGRIYIYNEGATVSTLFDLNGGTANLKISGNITDLGSDLYEIPVTKVDGTSATLTDEMVGETFYVTTGELKMQKFTITSVDNVGKDITATNASLSNLATGDQLVVSPIFCRVIGAAVVPQSQGQQFASFVHPMTRKIESIFTHFEDVSGTDSETDAAIYTGSVWKGNDSTPVRRDTAYQNDGTTVARTVDDGTQLYYTGIDSERGVEGRLIFPSVELAVANFDFNLVAMIVKGKVERSESEKARI